MNQSSSDFNIDYLMTHYRRAYARLPSEWKKMNNLRFWIDEPRKVVMMQGKEENIFYYFDPGEDCWIQFEVQLVTAKA